MLVRFFVSFRWCFGWCFYFVLKRFLSALRIEVRIKNIPIIIQLRNSHKNPCGDARSDLIQFKKTKNKKKHIKTRERETATEQERKTTEKPSSLLQLLFYIKNTVFNWILNCLAWWCEYVNANANMRIRMRNRGWIARMDDRWPYSKSVWGFFKKEKKNWNEYDWTIEVRKREESRSIHPSIDWTNENQFPIPFLIVKGVNFL